MDLVDILYIKQYRTTKSVQEAHAMFTFATTAWKEKVVMTVLKILNNQTPLLSCTELHVFHDAFVFMLE